MNKFLEEHSIKQVADPVDMNAAAITGARISMSKCDRLAIVLQMGSSTGAVVQATLRQHTAASGGTSKDLSVINPYWKKVGAATSFTKVVPTVAAALYDLASDFAASAGVVVFEVHGEDLDVNGGYSYVSVDLADSTAAKLLGAMYIPCETRYIPGYSEVF